MDLTHQQSKTLKQIKQPSLDQKEPSVNEELDQDDRLSSTQEIDMLEQIENPGQVRQSMELGTIDQSNLSYTKSIQSNQQDKQIPQQSESLDDAKEEDQICDPFLPETFGNRSSAIYHDSQKRQYSNVEKDGLPSFLKQYSRAQASEGRHKTDQIFPFEQKIGNVNELQMRQMSLQAEQPRSSGDLAYAQTKNMSHPQRFSLLDDKSEVENIVDQDQPIPFSEIERSDRDHMQEEINDQEVGIINNKNEQQIASSFEPSPNISQREMMHHINMAQYSGNQPKLIMNSQSRQQNVQSESRSKSHNQPASSAATGLNLSANDGKVTSNMSESDDNTLTDENKYQTAQKQEPRALIAASEKNSSSVNMKDKMISNKESVEYFSFVNQPHAKLDMAAGSEFGPNSLKSHYQVSMTNPYIMHRNSPLIREKDSASLLDRETPKLAAQNESSEIQNSNSSKRESKRGHRLSEYQQRLQQIEMQVQQKQMEINKQRMEAKFNGIHLDYFKPEPASQAVFEPASDNLIEQMNRSETGGKSHDRIEPTRSQIKRVDQFHGQNFETGQRNTNDDLESGSGSLQLKQTRSVPMSTKKSTQRAQNHFQNDYAEQDLQQQEGSQLERFPGVMTDDQSASQMQGPIGADSSDQMNNTMRSRQLAEHFRLNNSVKLESDFKESNTKFGSSDYRINEKYGGIFEQDDFIDQNFTYGHPRNQLNATEKSPKKQNNNAQGKESRNISQIISTIEKNKEFGQLDLSLDLKNQMKQCSTTRRHGQGIPSQDESYLLEQYGLSGNIVIHPQDRKRMQEPSAQSQQKPSKPASNLTRTKNMRSQKVLRNVRQGSQIEPSTPAKMEKQPSLSMKKQQKSQSSAQKKKSLKSDRKQVMKKEIALYNDSDEAIQVSSFIQEAPVPATTVQKKNTGRKKWLPSIDNLNMPPQLKQEEPEPRVLQSQVVQDNDSSSNSELPQPQLYSHIAPQPQPMDFQPLIHTSEHSGGRQSRGSIGFSNNSSNSAISLIEDKQPQDIGHKKRNQNDRSQNYNSESKSNVNRTQSKTQSNQVQLASQQFNTQSNKQKYNQIAETQAEVLKQLLKEEDLLYKYATEAIHEIQRTENQMKNQQSPDHQSSRSNFIVYQKLLIDASLEKPRFIMFARQLQVSFMITKSLIRVLPASLMTRFESKLRALCQNIHQSFLLIIDLILKQFSSDYFHQHDGYFSVKESNIHQSIDFKLLRNITSKKIKSKDNFARTLTIFRQNNEINILYLKKILKYILDSYSTDCSPFKPLAQDFQEIIRINYGSANTAAGTLSSNREESKAINHSILSQKEKEIKDLHIKLQSQVDELVQRPGVIFNKMRAANNANNVREPVHISPTKTDEDVDQQASPQPQTYRHLSPMKTTKDNFTFKDHEVLKRCKSTSKNLGINKNHLRSTQVNSYGQKPFINRETHNMSMSSVLQKQRLNPVISQNVYKGLNEIPVDTSSRKAPNMTQQSDNLSQYNVQSVQNQQQPMRMHDLINASSDGKNMGVLANRRNSKKLSGGQPIVAGRKEAQSFIQNSSSLQLGVPTTGKQSAQNCNETNYDEHSDNNPTNIHSAERIDASSSQMKSAKNSDSQQRTISSQAQGTSTKTQSSTMGADYIRKKYDPQGYRRLVTSGSAGSHQKSYQYRFNDREKQMKSSINEQQQRPQLKVKVGDQNRYQQQLDLNSSTMNQSVMAHYPQPTPLVSQKRGSLGSGSPTKITAGSPQKVNSLMKRYGSTNKLQTVQHHPSSHLTGHQVTAAHDSYQSKVKMLPAQQQTPAHQFNKNMFGTGGGHQKVNAASAGSHHQPPSRVPTDRKHINRGGHDGTSMNDQKAGAADIGFMLQESKDFILRMSSDPHQMHLIDNQRQIADQSAMSSQMKDQQPIAQITNVNNNINFYGTVVNHVYTPGDTGRESMKQVEQNFNEQFYSPQKPHYRQQQTMGGGTIKSAQPPSRRLTTEKKSSQAQGHAQHVSRQDVMDGHDMFNEYILENVEASSALQIQECDSSLFKQSSAEQRRLTHTKTQNKFDDLQYNQSILVENLDTSIYAAHNQKKNTFAQSFLFEPASPTLISPEKRPNDFNNKSQRSSDYNKFDQSYGQSNKKLGNTDKQLSKLHASGTGIGSGLKNLKSKQNALQQMPVKQNQAKSMNEKLTSSRKKDVRKEVVKPQSRPNMPQSQRDVQAPHLQQMKGQLVSNYSHRNSFDVKANEIGPSPAKASAPPKKSSPESVESMPIQAAQTSTEKVTDRSEQIRQYNMNLLQVEQQTNISSSCREADTPMDSRRDREKLQENVEITGQNQKQDYPEEEQDDQKEQQNDVTFDQNDTSKVEAEIDQDDEQALIDAEYRRLRKLVKEPYLPPLSQTELSKLPSKAKCIEDVYTLVLDLDETLIHFEMDEDVDPAVEEPGYYLIRPGAIKFLNELSEYYELVVFTAAMPDYADWILDNVDRHRKISHRLYRQHSTPFEDYAMKDLTKLGRDMSKIMIIDNLAENFNQLTPLNGIWVESWYDDMDDIVLQLLIPFLIDIVKNKVDVRNILTDQIKEKLIYKRLDEGKPLPTIKEISRQFGKKSQQK